MKETAAYPHSPASSFEQAVSAIKSIEGTDRKQVFNLRSQTPDVRFGRTALNRYIMKNEGILNS